MLVVTVSPLTSVLEQIEEAFAEYELDAKSCMQRAVCTYVKDAENEVERGDADAFNLIISGVSK